MERTFHRAKNFSEAESWDIKQLRSLSLQKRHELVKNLRRKVYGDHPPGIRECRPK
jgi:hypothetical protein